MISFKALEANSMHRLDPRRHFKIFLDRSCVTIIQQEKVCSHNLERGCKVQAKNKHTSLVYLESTQDTLALRLWYVAGHCYTSPHALSNLALK